MVGNDVKSGRKICSTLGATSLYVLGQCEDDLANDDTDSEDCVKSVEELCANIFFDNFSTQLKHFGCTMDLF